MIFGPDAAMGDLRDRLAEKAETLERSAGREFPHQADRLRAKAEGVRLAMSFVDEYIRGAWGTA